MSIRSVARHITCPAINYKSNTRITGVIFVLGISCFTLKIGFFFPVTLVSSRVSMKQIPGGLRPIITNKQAHGREGCIVAIVKVTRVEDVSSVLLKLPRRLRYQMKEITLDMAPNMEKIVRECFPAASLGRVVFTFTSWFTRRYRTSGATSLRSDRERERGYSLGERKRVQVQTCHAGKWRHAKTTSGTKPLLVVQDAFLVASFPGNEGEDFVQALPGYQIGLRAGVTTGTNLQGRQVERCRLHKAGSVV